MIGGHVGIKVNDNIGPCFKTHKGLRKGMHYPPILFDWVVDALAVILNRAKENDLLKGVLVDYCNGDVNMLPYVDATILLLKDWSREC